MSVDNRNMDFHAPRSGLLDRLRTDHVIRKIDRERYGFTTRNYHRNERWAHLGFVAMLVAGVIFAIAMAVG